MADDELPPPGFFDDDDDEFVGGPTAFVGFHDGDAVEETRRPRRPQVAVDEREDAHVVGAGRAARATAKLRTRPGPAAASWSS